MPIYNALLATNITPADVVGMSAFNSVGYPVFDPTDWARNPSRHRIIPAQCTTYASTRNGQPISIDAEDNGLVGSYFDDRRANRRRCRMTARRLRAGILAMRAAAPASPLAVYGFHSKDWYAAIANDATFTSWQAAMNYQASLYAPFVDRAAMDLYLFTFLTSLSNADFNTAIDRQLDTLRANAALCAGPLASARQLVYVWPQYHNADPVSPLGPVNPSLWQRLNERLVARADIDVVAWGVDGNDWVTWKATAPTLWPIFRTAWGI